MQVNVHSFLSQLDITHVQELWLCPVAVLCYHLFHTKSPKKSHSKQGTEQQTFIKRATHRLYCAQERSQHLNGYMRSAISLITFPPLQPCHHMTGYKILKRIRVTCDFGDIGEWCQVHQYFWWRQALWFHSHHKPSNLILWNWPNCRHSHLFSKEKKVHQACMVGLPNSGISCTLQQVQGLPGPRAQHMLLRDKARSISYMRSRNTSTCNKQNQNQLTSDTNHKIRVRSWTDGCPHSSLSTCSSDTIHSKESQHPPNPRPATKMGENSATDMSGNNSEVSGPDYPPLKVWSLADPWNLAATLIGKVHLQVHR